MNRRSPFRVPAAILTATAALLTLSGCMTVHGEREIVPAVSKDEAGTVLQQFIKGYNKANRTLEPKATASYETGALQAIDEAVIKGGREISPQGNPGFRPLKLTDARYTIPKQAGWPKFFVADTVSNRDGSRWFLVFTRNGIEEKWKAAYLSVLTEDEIPEFATDKDGYAEAVPAGKDSGLTVDPGALGKTYAAYLKTGEGDDFAPGQHTDRWRAQRTQDANRPGQRIQTVDEPYRFAPMGLRTKDGGALVFFATTYYQHKTVAEGSTIAVPPRINAVLEGSAEPTNRMSFTTVSEQAVQVPAKGAGTGSDGQIVFLNRLEAKTAAKPE